MYFQTDQTDLQEDKQNAKCFIVFVLKSLVNLHVLLGKINHISLMQVQIVLCWYMNARRT